jgi:hypothetical protein
MLVQAFKVDTDLPAAGRTHSVVSAVNTEQTLADYLTSIQARLVKGRRKRPAKAQSARGQKAGRKTGSKTGSKKR